MPTPKETALSLPHLPGVYRFFDKADILLYVGKAKDLKNRVSSYFNNTRQHSRKTLKLVSQIARIECTIVNSEFDALLLENNLIKAHQPKYNILLKDDKTYPFICVTREDFPRVLVTRQPEQSKGAAVFGPFSNVRVMQTLLELIKQLYPIRTCALALTPPSIAAGKFKLCLEYHIGNCLAPCEGLQSRDDYQAMINQVQQILKGNLAQVKQHFREQMIAYAEALEFEKAEQCKQALMRLEGFQSKSTVVNPSIQELDIITITDDEQAAYLNYMYVKEGAIIYTCNRRVKKQLDEDALDILPMLAIEFRQLQRSTAPEIITNLPINTKIDGAINIQPKIGDKKKLLDLSLKNALIFKRDSRKEKNPPQDADNTTNKAVIELQRILQMSVPPRHIECFDNSNIQGTNPVSAMVYFKDGKPLKKEYRHYNIKTVVGPDDFATMQEVVTRRYRRLLEEQKPLPDLIIIDGGKGQLSHACTALKELGIYGQMTIIGIAKRLEEIYLPEDEIPLHISKKSLALRLIQQARDEAHRFGISFHRKKRSQNSLHTQLEQIDGIGEKTIQLLLRDFKTIKNIRQQSVEILAERIGKTKARLIADFFANQPS